MIPIAETPTAAPGVLADRIFEIADEEKAQDLLVLDVVQLTALCDYFVLCHGLSLTHVETIAREIDDGIEEELGLRPRNRQSGRDAKWILLDYGSVVVHVFAREARDFYGLEDLWGDAVVARRQVPEAVPEGPLPE